MNLWKLLLVVAAGRGLEKLLREDGLLAWRDIDEWVKSVGGSDEHGRGYAGGRLSSIREGYVEISRRREGGSWRVQAELVLNAKLTKPAQRKVWVAAELEADLEQRFADGHRFRIVL